MLLLSIFTFFTVYTLYYGTLIISLFICLNRNAAARAFKYTDVKVYGNQTINNPNSINVVIIYLFAILTQRPFSYRFLFTNKRIQSIDSPPLMEMGRQNCQKTTLCDLFPYKYKISSAITFLSKYFLFFLQSH